MLKGEIGREVCLARRQGAEWYVGAIHTLDRGQMEIPLSFLTPGRTYSATLYSDQDPSHPETRSVKVETRIVDSAATLRADLPANGGLAIRIVPRLD